MVTVRFLFICILAQLSTWLVPTSLVAYDATVEPVLVPYEAVRIVIDTQATKVILAELKDSPEMYEIVVDATSTLAVDIRAVPTTGTQPTFTGIIIKQKEIRGIEAVARLSATDASWKQLIDHATGLPYLAGPYFNETLTPGTYQIEVSNPNNQGKYLLVIGSGRDAQGFFASFQAVRATYEFYGASKLGMLYSPYIYIPVGSLVTLLLMAVIIYKILRRFRKRVSTNHV